MNVDRRLLELALRARADLALSVGLGLLAGLVVVLQAHALSRVVVGVFLEGASLRDVRLLLLAVLALGLGRSAAGWAAEIFAQRVSGRVKMALRSALTGHLLALGPGYIRGERTGELTATLVQGVEALDAYLAQYLPRLAMAALLPVLLLAFIFPVDPISGLILILTAPLIPVFMGLIGSMAEARTRRQWLSLRRMSAHFLDVLQGLTTLKVLGRSHEQEDLIRRTSERFRRATMGVLKVAFLSALVLEMAATLGTALVAVGVGLRLLYGRLAFQEALFVLILAPEVYRPLRSLAAAFHAGLPGAESAKSIFAILSKPAPRAAHPSGERPQGGLMPEGPVAIEIQDVHFTYESGRKPALEGVSIRIPSGQKVALVGPTGAGKTTVAHLLLGFAEPDKGVIRVEGVPLREIDVREWRRRVAWVPQTPHLFHGTVAENIRLARPEATAGEVAEAARLAHAHAFIAQLPWGYDTPVGEGGTRLSGGEAQRVALARAFLKDAPFLILDEPTSQLDPVHESLVHESLRRLARGRTVLLIAHRMSTVVDADKIVLLSGGKVIEEGSHRSLLEEGFLYPRLVEASGRLP